MGGTPGTCLYLTAYELSKAALSNTDDESVKGRGNFLTHFTAGMLAETVW